MSYRTTTARDYGHGLGIVHSPEYRKSLDPGEEAVELTGPVMCQERRKCARSGTYLQGLFDLIDGMMSKAVLLQLTSPCCRLGPVGCHGQQRYH